MRFPIPVALCALTLPLLFAAPIPPEATGGAPGFAAQVLADTASQPALKTPWVGAYTLTGWVRLSAPGADVRFLNIYDTSGREIAHFDIAQGQARFEHKFGDRWQVVRYVEKALPINAWIHLTAQIDAEGTLRLFLDGAPVAERRLKGVPTQSIGKMELLSAKFPGQADAFRLVAGPLSEASVARLSKAGRAGSVDASQITLRAFEVAARAEHPDYSDIELRIKPGAIVPFVAGLISKSTVLPPTAPGERPNLMVSNRTSVRGRTFLPNNQPKPVEISGRYQMGPRVDLPRLTFGGVLFGGVLTPIRCPDGSYVMAGPARSPYTGLQELFLFAVPKNEENALRPVGSIPCGSQRQIYQFAYSGKQFQFVGDIDGDDVPDLMMSSGRTIAPYYPDAPKNFWTGEELPNSGRGKGYSVNGKWLGGDGITTFYWAKGAWSDKGELSFGNLRNIYSVEKDFPLQWRGDFGARAVALKIDGKPYLVIAGDLDRFMAMPVEMQGEDIRCGEAVNLLKDNAVLEFNYIMEELSVADIDGDGKSEIVVPGNPGSVVILGGDRAGEFTERNVYTMGGPLVMQTLIVPCKTDWNGDGKQDIVAGDASGWLMFWPGTEDAAVYGSPSYFMYQGKPLHIQAGYYGSIQGPNEARWGYLNPLTCDWNGDGQPELITCDINGDFFFWKRGKDPLTLQDPVRFTFNGQRLRVPWRQRPAFIGPGSGFLGENREGLILMNYDGVTCAAFPKTRGGTDFDRIQPLFYKDGNPLVTCGACGLWGRSKFLFIDWDGDGKTDILFSTNRASHPHIIKEPLPVFGAMPFFVRNVGTNEKPVFDLPVPVKYKGEYINMGTHIAALWDDGITSATQGTLLIGAEDGRVYAFPRKELNP